MKFRILGTSSGLPEPGKYLSGVYVENRGKKYLFDCGDYISQRLMHFGVNKDDLDAVVICHFHPDHIAGIFMLVQTLYLQGRSKELPIFVAERAAEFESLFSFFYTFPARLKYDCKILDISELSKHFPDLKAMANDHLKGYEKVIREGGYQNESLAYSLRVCGDMGDLVYSSDIATTDSIGALLEGAHSAIIDGGHPVFEQLEKLKHYDIKRILLTHGTPEASLNILLNDASGVFAEANDALIYRI